MSDEADEAERNLYWRQVRRYRSGISWEHGPPVVELGRCLRCSGPILNFYGCAACPDCVSPFILASAEVAFMREQVQQLGRALLMSGSVPRTTEGCAAAEIFTLACLDLERKARLEAALRKVRSVASTIALLPGGRDAALQLTGILEGVDV